MLNNVIKKYLFFYFVFIQDFISCVNEINANQKGKKKFRLKISEKNSSVVEGRVGIRQKLFVFVSNCIIVFFKWDDLDLVYRKINFKVENRRGCGNSDELIRVWAESATWVNENVLDKCFLLFCRFYQY